MLLYYYPRERGNLSEEVQLKLGNKAGEDERDDEFVVGTQTADSCALCSNSQREPDQNRFRGIGYL